MVQIFSYNPGYKKSGIGESLGMAGQAGVGLLQQWNQQQQQKTKRTNLSKVFDPNTSPEEKFKLLGTMDTETQLEAVKHLSTQQKQQNEIDSKKRDAAALSKLARGEQLTPQEEMDLSATSQRARINQDKPVFERTEDKLDAESNAKLANTIQDNYKLAQTNEHRYANMEKLDKSGNVAGAWKVWMSKLLNMPLSKFVSSETEEMEKWSADFITDITKVFPTGAVTDFKLDSFKKTIPDLLNSEEGRKRIIKVKRLADEMKFEEFKVYKDILKENKNRKPRDLAIQIDERTAAKREEIREKMDNDLGEKMDNDLGEEIDEDQLRELSAVKGVSEGTIVDDPDKGKAWKLTGGKWKRIQ